MPLCDSCSLSATYQKSVELFILVLESLDFNRTTLFIQLLEPTIRNFLCKVYDEMAINQTKYLL